MFVKRVGGDTGVIACATAGSDSLHGHEIRFARKVMERVP